MNVPYETGLIKNRYIGSTFIRPTEQQRMQGMRVRLNAISSVVKDKRVYLIDDSVVKGFTSRRICQLLKEAGAKRSAFTYSFANVEISLFIWSGLNGTKRFGGI